MLPARSAFYFDLASPLCYLAAERVLHELPVAAEWQPVLARELPGEGAPTAAVRARVERAALELGLQPLRWPAPFPFDSELAMRVATYAKQIGRAVAFAQAAFRQCYAGGRSLQDSDNVLIAAAACEMHPSAVGRAARMRTVAAQLQRTTSGALAAGVRELPAILVAPCQEHEPRRVFQGEHALAQATAALRARGRGAA